MAIPDFDVHVDIKRLRGKLAENQISREEFARFARVSYWHLCDILAMRVSPGADSRIKLVQAVDRMGWDDILLYPSEDEEELSRSSAI